MPDINNKIVKDINYLGKDFNSLRENLIEFAKTYYPNTVNDFNESSPGMMFLETSAYVGDLLSYYIDNQFKESMLPYATEKRNVTAMAQALGYIPRQTTAAAVNVDIFQTVPSIGAGNNNKPDFRYALAVDSGATVIAENGSVFRNKQPIDFSYSGSNDLTDTSIFTTDDTTGEATYYLLKKNIKFESGKVASETFSVGTAKPFLQLALGRGNIIDIIKVTDANDNEYQQVPYLAQDTIYKEITNNQFNDPELTQYNHETPYLLKQKRTSKRYISRVREDGKMIVEFGAGGNVQPDEEIIPNPNNVGSILPGVASQLDKAIDPTNFMHTRTYGQAPGNTIITIQYTYGGGIEDNVASQAITKIDTLKISSAGNGLDETLFNNTKNSIALINPGAAQGGRQGETVEEIRRNALAYFNAQGRCVTRDDYMIRVMTMPSRFGSVAKAYVAQDEQLNNHSKLHKLNNPLAINMYTLGYDANKKLIENNNATKENIKNYLTPYRMLTDSVTLKNAFIINIGLDFEIVTLPGFNSNDILLKCIDEMVHHFNIDRWQINEPILLSDILSLLISVKGVQSVPTANIINFFDAEQGYSGNVYDIKTATREGVVYPALDPSIFEVKYPKSDIKGRVTNI
jgi:hypothetical protein|tara:strand:+ start:888 stop:2774 length:1887 start_codon:yes stop_codon:yes gene_type:complete